MGPYLTPHSIFKTSYSARLAHSLLTEFLLNECISAQVLWAELEL